jgi:hypothetical protein
MNDILLQQNDVKHKQLGQVFVIYVKLFLLPTNEQISRALGF